MAAIADGVWKRLAALEALLNVQPDSPEEARATVVFYDLGRQPPEYIAALQRSQQAPGASMQGDRVVYLIPSNGR